MRATGWKLLGVAAVLAAAGVLISLYVGKLTTDAGSKPYTVPVTSQNGHPVVDLTIETVAAVGPQLTPSDPDWVSYLVRDTGVPPPNGVAPAGEYDRPRDDLQLRRQQRPAEPRFGQARGVGGNAFALNGKPHARSTRMTPRTPSRSRGSGLIVPIPASTTTRRTSVATRRARCRSPTTRSPSPSTRARRATTGGSASSPCAADRIERLRRPDADDRVHGRLPGRGVMAASAHAPAAGDRRDHGKRIIVAWIVASVIATPIVAPRPRPGAPAGEGQRPGRRAGVRQHLADDDGHSDHLPARRLLRLRALPVPPPRRGARRWSAASERRAHPGLLGRDLGAHRDHASHPFGTFELLQTGSGGGQGPKALVTPSGPEASRFR